MWLKQLLKNKLNVFVSHVHIYMGRWLLTLVLSTPRCIGITFAMWMSSEKYLYQLNQLRIWDKVNRKAWYVKLTIGEVIKCQPVLGSCYTCNTVSSSLLSTGHKDSVCKLRISLHIDVSILAGWANLFTKLDPILT